MDPLDGTTIVSDHIYTHSSYNIEPAAYVTTEDEVNDTCRVCLQNNAIENWNKEIVAYCGMSFKDFYYKFTQLEMLDADPYPKVLCQTCLVELNAAYFLMVKALESNAVLRGTQLDDAKPIFNENKPKASNVIANDNIKSKCLPEGISTLIKQNEELARAIEKLNKSLELKERGIDYSTYMLNMTPSSKHSKRSSFQEVTNCNSKKRKLSVEDDCDYQEIDTISEGELSEFEQNESELHTETEIPAEGNKKVTDFEESLSYEDDTQDFAEYIEETVENLNEHESDDATNVKNTSKETPNNQETIEIKAKRKYRRILKKPETKQKLVCAYCPRILADKHSLWKHEKTHDKNRQRKETCPQCGIKTFTIDQLKLHMQTHSSEREKKYQCEFCEKAYFGRGGLNIHRRIHLGKMLPCTLCPKEFYRQLDLDRHRVKIHGVAPIHGNVTFKKKYFIHCNKCNKTLRTTSWKEHQANHLKIPLLKCSLCDINFCTREALKWHMRKIHQYKKREEYEPHIVYLSDTRLSHKLLQQQELLIEPKAPEVP